MSSPIYICLNGQKKLATDKVLSISNRAFRYGDALFETIRCMHQVPAYFRDHYQRLVNGMSLVKMDIRSLPSKEKLQNQIADLIRKNRLFGDVRIRLTVFREDGGLYTPQSNKINYLIESSPLETSGYELNKKGLLTDIYDEDTKPINRFAHYKTANALLFVLAGNFKKNMKKDDVLICNSHLKIIEGLASNLYWVKDNVIYTPFRSSGCVDGIMRKQLIRLMKKHQLNFREVAGTNEKELLEADEIFLSNAIQGIQWIVGLKEKRYYCKMAKELSRLLNDDVYKWSEAKI